MKKYLSFLSLILFVLTSMLLLQAHSQQSQADLEFQFGFPHWAKTKVSPTLPNGTLSLQLDLGCAAKTQISLRQANGEEISPMQRHDLALAPGKYQFDWDIQRVKTTTLLVHVVVDGLSKTHRIKLEKYQIID